MESASAHEILDFVHELQGLEKCHLEVKNISVLSIHHTLYPTFTSTALSFSFLPLLPLLPLLDTQPVVSAFFLPLLSVFSVFWLPF